MRIKFIHLFIQILKFDCVFVHVLFCNVELCLLFFFSLIWYFEPSILTTVSLIGLAVGLIDFLVPLIGQKLMSSKW